jgi:serine/threonine protein kinase
LHYARHIIGHDLQPRNIHLNEDNHIRLKDIPCSHMAMGMGDAPPCPTRENELREIANVEYSAPEVLMEQPRTAAGDIWSLGVLLFEMTTGHPPFQSPSVGRLTQKILRDDPTFPGNSSPLFCDIILRMLTKDPLRRITLQNIKQHPWVNEELGHPLFLNFSDLDALRTRLDPLNAPVDPKVSESVQALGLDVSQLPVQLLNGSTGDAVSVYRQYARREMSRCLATIVPRLLRRQESCRCPHSGEAHGHESLPRFAPCLLAVSGRRRNATSVGHGPLPVTRVKACDRIRPPSRPPRLGFGVSSPFLACEIHS